MSIAFSETLESDRRRKVGSTALSAASSGVSTKSGRRRLLIVLLSRLPGGKVEWSELHEATFYLLSPSDYGAAGGAAARGRATAKRTAPSAPGRSADRRAEAGDRVQDRRA